MNFERIPGIFATLAALCYIMGLAIFAGLTKFPFLLGFAAGGALVIVNLLLSAKRINQTGFSSKGASMASIVGGFYIRLTVLGICLYLLIKSGRVDPIGLLAGLSIIPGALVMMIIMIYLANRRPEEV